LSIELALVSNKNEIKERNHFTGICAGSARVCFYEDPVGTEEEINL
jgi:hypothetical protein